MKVTRLMFALFGFVAVWVVVTALTGVAIHVVIPWQGPEFLGVSWAAVPASIVGAAAGCRVYNWISRAPNRRGIN